MSVIRVRPFDPRLLLAVLLPVLPGSFAAGEEATDNNYQIEQTEEGAVVTQGGQPVTTYHKSSVSRPILWPIYGPEQIEMTRGYPMREAGADEKTDHIHHRSLWIGHEINGIDFWAEGSARAGKVVHSAFERTESGPEGEIQVRCDWIGPDGTKVLEDRRRYRFSGPANQRQIDFDVTLVASEVDLHFEDTKEGTVALRVAEWMKVDAKKGGQLVNEHGQADAEAWGKRSRWIDYTGKAPSGQVVGIAFFNHPESYGHPTRWHARTYGLFAANPFGVYHFEGGEPTEGFHLPKGETVTLYHRVIFHEGQPQAEQINQWYEQYATTQMEKP